ncbi:MAG: WG repeat-containing protein [Bacteroidetes bacterium]|nr:WG repeat-containing protein [Bacteroidota bacterium]
MIILSMTAFGQMLPVKSGRLWGIIDPNGKMLAEPKYNAIARIMDRQAVVVLDGKYGLVDSGGRTLIEPSYSYLKCISNDVILTNLGGECTGEDCEGGKWGIMNRLLDQTIAPTFQLIAEFNDKGHARVNVGGKCGYEDCEGGLWGIVDTTATELLPAQFKRIMYGLGNEVYVEGDKGWGLYDLALGRMIVEPKYEKLERISPTHIAMRSGKLWGLLDNRGKLIVEPTHDGFKDAGLSYVAYQKGLFLGLMDSTGKILNQPIHTFLWVNPYHWVTYKIKDYTGLADTSERVITRDMFTEVALFQKDFCLVKANAASGAVNRAGTEIVPVKYDNCLMANDSTILARNGNYLKWYATDGQVRKFISFDSLGNFTASKVARAKLKGRWGMINVEGQWLIPPQYDDVKIYLQAAKARLGEDWTFSYFDENGHSSKVKRIVIIKEKEDEEVDLLSIAGNSTLGWFVSTARNLWGLRDNRTGRVMIDPTYPAIEVVPGTKYTLVKAKIKGSEDFAWGLVDHTTGRTLSEPLFEKVFSSDWRISPMARVIYAGSGRYALLSMDGKTATFENAAFIGPFCDSIARINLGGRIEWSKSVAIDTILSDQSRDVFSNEIKTNYQYCRGGKWGYIDTRGKWLKPVEYESALDFDGNIARIKQKGKWGAVNKTFAIVVEPKFDFIERLFSVNDRILFAVGEDRTAYGFIDQKGEIFIQPRFAEVGQFSEGLVKIREGQKWGYANLQGEVVIPPQYGAVGDFHEGRARVRDNRAWGYIDSVGNVLTPQKYLRAGDFKEGLAWVQTEKFFGFIGLDGQMEIKPAFSAVGDFSEGLAPAKRKGVFGLIDRKGNWAVQPNYYRIGSFKDSVAVIQEKGQFGLINPKGEFLVRPHYKEIGDFSEGLSRFKSGLEYGYMDAKGITRIEDQFANAGDFACGRAAIFVQGKWGFIDTSGAVIIKPEFLKVNAFTENRAAVRVGNKWGFIDPSGEIAVPLVYDKVTDFKDGRAAVFVSGLGWGFVNQNGTRVIDCEYDGVGFRQEGIISVQMGTKWGLINTFGAVMTPCKYDAIGNFSQGLASAMMRRSIGVVDGNGKVLLDAKYDTVRRMGDLIQVEDDDAIGYIDLEGKWIWALTK